MEAGSFVVRHYWTSPADTASDGFVLDPAECPGHPVLMVGGGGTLVLLSGGIDSSATLALCSRRDSAISCLFVDYGQAAAQHERASAARISSHYEKALTVVECSGIGTFGSGYIRGRNALLLSIALSAFPFEFGAIVIGIHAGTPYADCSPGFITTMQRCFDIYSQGKVQVAAPYVDHDKAGVVASCRELGVPLELTYSCEAGSLPPCGHCASCLDRLALHV